MIIADMHLHVYPVYDTETILRGCVQRLSELSPATVCAACLTERHDCHVYHSLLASAASAVSGDDSSASPRFEALENGRCIVFRAGGGLPPLFILPGRQISTRERVEVLCIGSDASIPDGEPAEITIRRIGEVGGLPVLAWAVGKWLFKRRRVVNHLLDTFGPGRLLIGDSSMRPVFWPEPGPMRRARRQGYRVLAGSDPLPKAGDEAQAGRYATLLGSKLDPRKPAASLLAGVMNPAAPLGYRGRRCGVFEFPGRIRS